MFLRLFRLLLFRSLPWVFVAGMVVGLVDPAHAQVATLRAEENFRAEPNGAILGQLFPGTRVTVLEQEGNWTRAALEGVVWTASMQIRAGEGFDLVISESGGENVRDEPAGRIAGRLASGTLLEELARVPGWVRVRRTGWIWTPSIEVDGGVTQTPPADAVPSPSPSPAPAPVAPTPAPAVPSAATEEWLSGPGRAGILSAPDGDTLGLAERGSDLRVLSREGNWARVQLEGWVWIPGMEREAADGGEPGSVLSDVRAGDLSADPERYRSRLVRLDLQFISLERAEQIRTDFLEGEPFLLTRSTDQERGFVYVAVSQEQMAQLSSLTPLQNVRVLGRVRSGASAFTGRPILDLIELERIPW